MRKALQAKQKKAEMQKKIKDLENECNGLEKSVREILPHEPLIYPLICVGQRLGGQDCQDGAG